MAKSFAQLVQEFTAAGRVQPFPVFNETVTPIAAPSGLRAALRAQRKRENAERIKQADISRKQFREDSARINELGLEGFKEFSRERSPAGRRRFLGEFRAKQKQAKIAEGVLKQQGKLELEEFKIQGRARLKLLDRELTAEDRVRKTRNNEVLNQFRQAQTQKIIQAPQFEKFKSNLRRIEDGDKARNQLQRDALKQQQDAATAELNQQRKLELVRVQAALKPPKETSMQEYLRNRNTGAFRTVRDIALYWASKGRKGKSLQEITEMSAAQMGLSPEEVSGLSGFNPFSATPADRFNKFLNTTLPGTSVNQLGSKVLEQYGSRESAERSLKSIENQVRSEAHTSGQAVDDNLISEISQGMDAFNRKWPDQPSIYNQLDTFDPGQAAVSDRSLGTLNKQLGDLFNAGKDGSPIALDYLKDTNNAINDFLSLDKQTQEQKRKQDSVDRFTTRKKSGD